MKSRLWLNLALVIVVAILVALVYFKPGHKPAAPPTVLTPLKAQDIQDIKIAQPDMPTVELVRHATGWEMTAPSPLPADQFQVQSLLDSLQAVVKSSFPAAHADLAKYGLNPAHVQLWLNGTEFDFGDTEPINNDRYVLSDGQVHLVSGLLFYRLNHRPYWWASKQLLPANAKITALQLPNATLALKGAQWQLSPANPAVSADAIQTLIENWQNAQAIAVEKIGAGKSGGEVAIEFAGQKNALRFAIIKNPDFFVLARPDLGVQYELDNSQSGALLTFKSASPASKTTSRSKPVAAGSHK